MSPETIGGPSLKELGLEESPNEVSEEEEIGEAVDKAVADVKKEKTSPRGVLELQGAARWFNDYFRPTGGDPMRTDVVSYDKLEDAATKAQTYLDKLSETVYNPNAQIRPKFRVDEKNMKQFAKNIIRERDMAKASEERRRKRREEKEKIAA